MKTDHLIEGLIREHKPVKVYRPFAGPLSLWAVSSALVVLGGTEYTGWRGGLTEAVTQSGFWVETALYVALAAAALWTALAGGIPGMLEKRPLLSRATWLFFAAALMGIVFKAGQGALNGRIFSNFGESCGLILLGASVISAGVLWSVTRKASPTRPGVTALMMALASVAVGLLLVHLHCGAGTASHLLVGHAGFAFLFLALAGAVFRKQLQW